MRGRPLIVQWDQSPEELQKRASEETNPRRRARLVALGMLAGGHTIGDAGRAVGADYRTVQRWVSWYRQGGLEDVLTRTPGHAAPGRPSLLNTAQLTDLLERVASGQFKTVRDAVNWSNETYGVRYTYTGMYALLGRRSDRRRVRRHPMTAQDAAPESADPDTAE